MRTEESQLLGTVTEQRQVKAKWEELLCAVMRSLVRKLVKDL
jgi:hypothetical protein